MTKVIYKGRAPLRLGLGGGGTDVSPYCDAFGGAVLNVTIALYANCTVEDLEGNEIKFESCDLGLEETTSLQNGIDVTGDLILHKAAYQTVCERYLDDRLLPLRITTDVESPVGSGLGSSSAMVVAIVMALKERFSLALDTYETAQLCYEIEREVAGLSGGKQDQYAATFGGVNFMEFGKNNDVLVSPLKIRTWIRNELESSLLLCFTGQSRKSAKIIDDQAKSMTSGRSSALNGMHKLKKDAVSMKKYLLLGDFRGIAAILNTSWEAKKATSREISNERLENLIETGIAAGALAAKVSGAGGGGFIFFLTRSAERLKVSDALESLGAKCSRCKIEEHGADSWSMQIGAE